MESQNTDSGVRLPQPRRCGCGRGCSCGCGQDFEPQQQLQYMECNSRMTINNNTF
eukprot:UN18448